MRGEIKYLLLKRIKNSAGNKKNWNENVSYRGIKTTFDFLMTFVT